MRGINCEVLDLIANILYNDEFFPLHLHRTLLIFVRLIIRATWLSVNCYSLIDSLLEIIIIFYPLIERIVLFINSRFKQKTCFKLSSLLTYRKTCPAQDPSSPESFLQPVPVQYPSISNISWEFCAATIFPCFFLEIDI